MLIHCRRRHWIDLHPDCISLAPCGTTLDYMHMPEDRQAGLHRQNDRAHVGRMYRRRTTKKSSTKMRVQERLRLGVLQAGHSSYRASFIDQIFYVCMHAYDDSMHASRGLPHQRLPICQADMQRQI